MKAGRKKGSKNRTAEEKLKDLQDEFKEVLFATAMMYYNSINSLIMEIKEEMKNAEEKRGKNKD